MKRFLFLLVLVCTMQVIHAQYIYTIKADSVKITNSCDTAELIIENHTQTVPGFLFNKGRGRTEFRKVFTKVDDSVYLIGIDTLKLSVAWLQGGNRFGSTGLFGTLDNNPIDFYTNNTQQLRLNNTGNLLVGTNVDNGYKLQIKGSVSLTNADADIRSPRYPVLIGDESPSGGTGFLFDGDATGSSIRIGCGHSNRLHKFYFQTAGQPADTIAAYNFTYDGNAAHGLNFYSLSEGKTQLLLSGHGNLLLGSNVDNLDKLQVHGNIYADGTKHLLGNLAIVSGIEPPVAGSATGIRVDDPSNGSFIFQGTNQGWAHDMFVFTDTYNGLGQDVYFQDQSIIKIKSGVRSNNIAGNSTSMLNIQPNYNLDPAVSNPLIIRGIYYKPTVTSLVPGSKHVAIETVTGDVLLGTTSGNTGIGTNSPSAQLHTTGTVRFGGLTNNNSLTRIVVSDANGNLSFRDYSTFVFNGTMNSDLAVNGTVSAQKMLISQTGRWPDYVFNKQYHLPSLTEVESFINQNNHLPGIPSAAEVEKKGIDVASNQAGLLKKIEELTLYAIEQEKKLQKQSEEIAELRKMIISISQSKK
jgi:hypothetical protein